MCSLQAAKCITNAFCSDYLVSFGLSFCICQIGSIWVSECEVGTLIHVGGGGLVAKSYPTLCNPMDYKACQAPLSMRFFMQEHWSGLPFPSPGDLPHPGIEPGSPALQADSLPTELWRKPSAYNSVTLLLTQDEIYRLQVFHHRLEYLFPMWHSFLCSAAQTCQTLCDPMDCILPVSSVHGIFHGRNTGASCWFLLQGIFPTQESNPGFLHLLRWQAYSLLLSHLGSPDIYHILITIIIPYITKIFQV